jgi:hypothetical protein
MDVPDWCYYGLFYDYATDRNTALTQAPKLPATTLAKQCYSTMFTGCTSLTQTPELPATTLAELCYNGMFYYCTSLSHASFPNLNKEIVESEIVKRQDVFFGAADNIEVTCKNGILVINSTEA